MAEKLTKYNKKTSSVNPPKRMSINDYADRQPGAWVARKQQYFENINIESGSKEKDGIYFVDPRHNK